MFKIFRHLKPYIGWLLAAVALIIGQVFAELALPDYMSDIINNDYVLITLYVDNKTPLPSPVKIVENGTERTLRTVGDKWSYLQRVKFGANAQPFYVLIDNEGKPLNKSYSYDEDIPKYIEFLQTGLENYKKEK